MKKPLKLKHVADLKLKPRSETCFRLTTWKPSHFPTQLEIHSLETSWRTFLTDGLPTGAVIRTSTDGWHVDIFSSDGWTSAHTEVLRQRIMMSYGLNESRSQFIAMAKRHPILLALPASLQTMYSSCPENLFELGILGILLQNTTVTRSRDMLAALLRLCGTLVDFDEVNLYCFFNPQSLVALGWERLRSEVRVGYRDKVLLSMSEYFTGRKDLLNLPPETADATIVELLKIKGIGPYTAGIIASSVSRNPSEYGLDVWNRRILSRRLTGSDDFPADSLRDFIRKEFAPYDGLAVEMIVESEYLRQPVCPIYATDVEARHASHIWPRPQHLQSVGF